jgi:cysteinyl-tRNA synthetase
MGNTEIDKLVKEMQDARKAKNFARGDEIRNQLNQMGIIVEVTKDGARWRRK